MNVVICLSANTVTIECLDNFDKSKPLALVLFASPRNGYTKKLLNAFLNGLNGSYNIKIIDCFKLSPRPCIACGICEKTDNCCFNDLDEYDEFLNDAELLVFASPVYNLSVPSPLKAIIDRSQRYYSKRFSLGIKPPIKIHKRSVLLLTCGSSDKRGFQIITDQLLTMFTIINAELYASVCMPQTDNIIDTRKFENIALMVGESLKKINP